jgi:hypothetical protein
MPIHTVPGTMSPYWLICFDKHGVEREDEAAAPHALLSERLLAEARQQQPTDVFFSSHGWKGDVPGAKDQYDRWFGALLAGQDDVRAMGPAFRPLWIGIHWPSLPFGEETLDGASFAGSPPSPEEMMEEYVRFFDEDSPAVRPLLQQIFGEHTKNPGAVQMPDHTAQSYRELAQRLGYTSGGPDAPPDSDGVPFDPVAAFEASEEAADFGEPGVLSGLLAPIRQLSFWTMKKRARRIGENALHPFCSKLQQELPDTRLHLIGHSFGCIVVSSILGGQGGIGKLPRPVDSLVLIQGAVSLWAFADHIDLVAKPGYFNGMLRRPAVRGPIVATTSTNDWAVGVLYPLAVGVVGQVSLGPDLPVFGGVGTWGMQGLKDVENLMMGPLAERYAFKPGGLYNLDATEFVGGHSLIDGPEVAHAIWAAVRPAPPADR